MLIVIKAIKYLRCENLKKFYPAAISGQFVRVTKIKKYARVVNYVPFLEENFIKFLQIIAISTFPGFFSKQLRSEKTATQKQQPNLYTPNSEIQKNTFNSVWLRFKSLCTHLYLNETQFRASFPLLFLL